jgi:hypothetical protein
MIAAVPEGGGGAVDAVPLIKAGSAGGETAGKSFSRRARCRVLPFATRPGAGPGNAACDVNASIQSDRYDCDPVGNLLHRYWLPASAVAQMS